MLMTSGAIGAAAASLGVPASMLAAPSSSTRSYRIRSQEGSKRVIFVTHDDNPFFIPVRFALEEFGEMAGWETQWVGPPQHDEQATLQFQLDAIAAQPLAIGFTRVNTTMFDEPIQQAQEAGIFAILYNTASEGYQDLGVAYVGQDFIPAGIVNGRNAAKYAQEITGRTDGEIILGTIAPGHSALDARMEGTRQGIAVYAEKGDAIVGFAHADYVNWFTGTWIEQQGLEGRFSNGGFDLLPGVMDAIQVGTSQWAIGQNPYAQGWMTAALIHMATAHGYPAFSYDTGAEIVDLSNIDAVAAREAIFAE
jgi:ribose transport system substrate-binding protein